MRLLVACCVLLAALAVVRAEEADAGVPKFERFFIMMFENHGYAQCMGNQYWQAFSKSGLALTNFKAIGHPSQPNYVAQIGGDTLGVTGDQNFDINATNLVDLLERHNITWKTYQEDYVPAAGGNCMTASKQGKYYRKHNPFMTFDDIRLDGRRCAKIVPSSQLDRDLAANALPQFSYYTPNIDNDAHDTNLDFAGKYLQQWLSKYMANPAFSKNTLVLITFDEDEYLEGNHIFAVLLGPYVTPNTSEGSAYTHYSLTATIERNWGIGDLGRKDKGAKDFLGAIKNARRRTWLDDIRDAHIPLPPPRRRDNDTRV